MRAMAELDTTVVRVDPTNTATTVTVRSASGLAQGNTSTVMAARMNQECLAMAGSIYKEYTTEKGRRPTTRLSREFIDEPYSSVHFGETSIEVQDEAAIA
ncbi:hypothetical protein ACH5RR_029194 [Cinchona calisaya]|uniref:Uncharacterized protein n=1 Tax=Cinchona calisaya TaxID=153742 RepID=A0ABD2YW70_9GENT